MARGEVAEEDLTVYEAMDPAPLGPLSPVAGGADGGNGTLPIVILLEISIHRRVEQVLIGLGWPDAFSDRIETAF